MSEISKTVKDLADKIKDKVTVSEDRQALVFDKDVYKAVLPEGLTVETVKAVKEHEENLGLATLLVAGDKAADLFKEDKELAAVKATINSPQGRITATVSRHVTHRNPQTGEATERYNFGNVAIVTRVGGAGLKNVRESISQYASRFNV